MIIFFVLQIVMLVVEVGFCVALIRTRDTRYMTGVLVTLCLCIGFMAAYFLTKVPS